MICVSLSHGTFRRPTFLCFSRNWELKYPKYNKNRSTIVGIDSNEGSVLFWSNRVKLQLLCMLVHTLNKNLNIFHELQQYLPSRWCQYGCYVKGLFKQLT